MADQSIQFQRIKAVDRRLFRLTILLKGGDYLIAVKDNQPTLHKRAQSKLANQPPAYTSEIECSHGRIEIRQLFRVKLDEDISSFPQGRQLLGITRYYTTKTEEHSSINMAFEHYGANPALALHQVRKAHPARP